MIYRLLFVGLIVGYVAFILPFTAYLKNRPVSVKLGYVPSAEVLRVTVGDQRLFVAHATIVKVLIYYGTLVENFFNKIDIPAEHHNMYNSLQTAVKLDPYNSDAYYFSQGAFTWDVGRAQDVNNMLDYGMKFRSWDYTLPFFAGFNSAYFLKQYEPAARYMKRAAEISGHPLLTNLAARYFYESKQSELGVKFLEMMEKGAKDEQVRKWYRIRKSALLAVIGIQDASNRFKSRFGRYPSRILDLVEHGFINKLPEDPYGGQFYLDGSGAVLSTSKFAYREQLK